MSIKRGQGSQWVISRISREIMKIPLAAVAAMHASRDKRQKTKDKSTHTHTTPLVHNIVGKDRSSHHLPASCATKHL
eukprot:scaffold31331_cov67-Skeletonema_dohrnii-CCMP3373.AAC.1